MNEQHHVTSTLYDATDDPGFYLSGTISPG